MDCDKVIMGIVGFFVLIIVIALAVMFGIVLYQGLYIDRHAPCEEVAGWHTPKEMPARCADKYGEPKQSVDLNVK